MDRLVFAIAAVCCLAQVHAMPTQAELKKAQPLVAELMAPAMTAFKEAGAKDKTAAAVKVADASAEFAKAAETEAAKFLLLKGSVNFYTRGEAYDQAADALAVLLSEVKDVPPAVVAEIAGKATGRISETKAPRLFALYRKAKLQVRAAGEAKTLAQKLKKVKSDALQRRYAEALAVSGDWKTAYGEFAKLSDAKLKAVVEAEANGTATNAESGEFWWSYEPTIDESEDFFKAHAASFYRKALDNEEITGLKRKLVEQRIEGMAVSASKGATSGETRQDTGLAETSTGTSTSGKSWQEKGDTAWLMLPKGEKLEFAKCPAGGFDMGFKKENSHLKLHSVRISRPFWISKNFVTYGQWDSLVGKFQRLKAESCQFMLDVLGGDRAPVGVSYGQSQDFLKKLNDSFGRCLRPGYVFRLPSEAEYEYALKAGRSPYKLEDAAEELTTIEERVKALQSKGFDAPKWQSCPWRVPYFAVGSKKANKWGVYDMATAGWTYVLDSVKTAKQLDVEALTPFYVNGSVDPVQICEDPGSLSLLCGCGWGETKVFGRVWMKILTAKNKPCGYECFLRVVIGPDLVSEWKAKNGKK